MTMSLRQAVDQAAGRLKLAGVDNAKRDASILLAFVLKRESSILYQEPERELTDPEKQAFDILITRRVAREPVSHLTGHREFWSQDFLVSADVLDPRADSETLIEAVLAEIKDGFEGKRILDLGVGSGCLLLSLLSEMPDATGVGVDASERALRLAQRNAERLGLADRAELRTGNWCDGIDEAFDIVISNPPYIPEGDISGLQPEVRQYEPRIALTGGLDGLDCYRTIIAEIHTVLRPNGLVVFEVGAGQAPSVGDMLLAAGLERVKCYKDLSSIERCISARRGK